MHFDNSIRVNIKVNFGVNIKVCGKESPESKMNSKTGRILKCFSAAFGQLLGVSGVFWGVSPVLFFSTFFCSVFWTLFRRFLQFFGCCFDFGSFAA